MRSFPKSRVGLLHLIGGLAVLAYMVAPALGQPIVEYIDSIEWMAADSSLIVRGTIAGLETEEEPEEYSLWHTVAFRVDKTLKGEHRKTLEFMVRAGAHEKELGRWKEERRPLLVFLEESRCVVARGRKYARFPFAPRTGYIKGSFLELDAAAKPEAYTLELRAINDPEEVTRAIQERVVAPRNPGKACYASVSVPGKLGLLRLNVPVDSRLEAAARQWVGSNDKEFRRQGAAALIYFRSDANAEILKGLLDDPAVWNLTREEGGRIVRKERAYFVREEAYSVLDAWEWEYDAPRPILREPLSLVPDSS